MLDIAFTGVLLAGFFIALLVCIELGRRVGRNVFAGDQRPHPTGLATVETVSFGLLGLLLAFTFSGAAGRLDSRRAQIVDEANAISTAWLRVDLLPENTQPALRDAFRKYTDSRIAIYRIFSESGVDAALVEFERSTVLQRQIWTLAIAALRDDPGPTVVVMNAINEMFDIAAMRIAATQMHPPVVVYVVLGLISLVCGFLAGYEMGATEVPSRPHIVLLALILTFTFYVIFDFEYPRIGVIRIDDFDQLLLQLRASMG